MAIFVVAVVIDVVNMRFTYVSTVTILGLMTYCMVLPESNHISSFLLQALLINCCVNLYVI